VGGSIVNSLTIYIFESLCKYHINVFSYSHNSGKAKAGHQGPHLITILIFLACDVIDRLNSVDRISSGLQQSALADIARSRPLSSLQRGGLGRGENYPAYRSCWYFFDCHALDFQPSGDVLRSALFLIDRMRGARKASSAHEDVALSVRSCGFYCNWQSAKDALARQILKTGRRLLTRFSLGCVGIPRHPGFSCTPLCAPSSCSSLPVPM
jgi:hypothetical protein